MDSDRKLFDCGTIAPVNNQVVDVYRSAHLWLDLVMEEHSSSVPRTHSKIFRTGDRAISGLKLTGA